jgi:hypothetical protein
MSPREFARTARAAACACALALIPLARAQDAPLTLRVTVGTDLTPGSCATTQTLAVTAGDQVNFCYTVRNDSSDTLAFHTLSDDVAGDLLRDYAHVLAPGQSFQYNAVRVIAQSQAPTATWTAATALPAYVAAANEPDADRVFADGFDGAPAYAFEDISATGTNLNLDDDGEATVDIGFDFTFYGITSDRVRVGNNGGILFGVDAGDLGYNNLPLPNATLGPAILPYWDDFDSEGGGVYAQTLGEAPHRRLVVQWKDRLHYDGSENVDGATFEAVLHEGSNRIVFQYADVDLDGTEWDGGASATIGLNRGDLATQVAYEAAIVAAGSAIAFTPTPVTSYSASDRVTIDAGAPHLVVTPAAVAASVAAGGSTTAPLAIGNDGNRDLVWSLAEAPDAARTGTARAALPALARPAPTTAYAPRARAAVLTPADKAGIGLAGAAVPAFGVNLNALAGNTLVSFDAAAPGSTTAIAPITRTLVGGAFLDDDFGTLYTLDFDTGEFLALSTADGSEQVVGTAATPANEDWSGLALDRSSGTLYASSTQMSGGVSSTLHVIDPATGAATPVGPIAGGGRIIEIAADAAGQLYGVDIAGDALVAIDKATGAASAIGPLGFDAEFAEGLDFDAATGLLYFAAVNNESPFSQPGQMYTIDPATGHATLVGGISVDPTTAQIAAFAIATAGGPCVAPQDVPWLSVSQTAGTTAPGASTSLAVAFDAGALAPGSYAATLCIASNDPGRPQLGVPVSLTVN